MSPHGLSFPQGTTKELFQTREEIVLFSETAATLESAEKADCQQAAPAKPAEEGMAERTWS